MKVRVKLILIQAKQVVNAEKGDLCSLSVDRRASVGFKLNKGERYEFSTYHPQSSLVTGLLTDERLDLYLTAEIDENGGFGQYDFGHVYIDPNETELGTQYLQFEGNLLSTTGPDPFGPKYHYELIVEIESTS